MYIKLKIWFVFNVNFVKSDSVALELRLKHSMFNKVILNIGAGNEKSI